MFEIGRATIFSFNSRRMLGRSQKMMKFGVHMLKGTLMCNLCE